MKKENKEVVRSFIFMFVIGAIFIAALGLIDSYLLSTTTSDVIPNQLESKDYPQLQWNNLLLNDSTIYNPSTNICTGSRYGMNITISPCTAYSLLGNNIEQNVKFQWNGLNNKNISWIFVYDNDLDGGSISVLQNVSSVARAWKNTWVSNYLVNGVVSFVNLTQKPSSCDLGNLNNTQFYNVTKTNVNGTYTETICFTDRTIVNATAFRISGNVDLLQDVTVWNMKYNDVTNQITYLGKGLLGDSRSYYKVNDVSFSPNEIIDTKWVYTPKDKTKSGKWHILGYDSNVGLVNSIVNDQYLYIDPWWSASWNKKKQINITRVSTGAENNYSVYMNITYDSDMQADFDDLRFTDGSETISYPYWIESKVDSVNAYVWVKGNMTPAANTTWYMYYGNTGATAASNFKQAFIVADDFLDGSLDSSIWDNKSATTTYSETTNGWLYLTGPAQIYGKVNSSSHSWLMATFWHNATGTADSDQVGIAQYGDGAASVTAGKIGTREYGDSQVYGLGEGGQGNVGSSAASRTLAKKIIVRQNATWANVERVGNGNYTQTVSANVNVTASLYGTASSDRVVGISNYTLRHWSILEPTSFFGGEESQAAGSASPTFTFISQSPADLTTGNTAGGVAIRYNITGGTVNTSTVGLFWLTNSTILPNQTSWVNGSASLVGFTQTAVTNVSNISDTWYFNIDDNLLPATYLLSPAFINNIVHSETVMDTDNSLIKVMVFNMTNRTTYNILEYNIVNETATSDTLRIYYCNSTYTTGNLATSPNCANVANVLASQNFNHTHNQSTHWTVPITINSTTSTIGGIKITGDLGYFVFRGRQTDGWTYRYVPTISRAGGTQTSGNLGATYSDLSGTLDYHLHQFNDDATFNYYVCGNFTTGGIYNCSTMRSDLLNQSALPPSPPVITSPLNLTYGDKSININYTASISPVNATILYYNISLYDADDVFNSSIRTNNSLNLSFVWNTSSIITGSFNVHVTVYDTIGFTATGESEVFSINNTFNTTTTLTTTPSSPINYGTASNFSCFNDYGLNTSLYINGVDKSNEKSLSVVRSAGTYTVNCTALNDATGNLIGSSQQATYTINKVGTPVTLSLSPSASITYGAISTATGANCPSQLTCTLTENSIGVSNPRIANLSAGTYTYNYSTVGNENYTANSTNATLTISKATPPMSVTLSPASSVVNGTPTTATGLGCPDGSCMFTRDAVVVTNPESTTLDIGSYVYLYTFLGNTNYTAYSPSATLTITPVAYGGNNGTVNFTATNLSQTVNFRIPYNFTTRAFMNLSTIEINPYLVSNFSASNATQGIEVDDMWYNGTNLFYVSTGSNEVWLANTTGQIIKRYAIAALDTPTAIIGNRSNLFILSAVGTPKIIVTDFTGNYIRNYSIPASIVNAYGLWGNSTNFWIVDNSDNRIYYTNSTGGYISNFTNPTFSSIRGITNDGTNFWIVDTTRRLIFKTNSTFSIISNITFEPTLNENLWGIDTYENNLWVAEKDTGSDDKIVQFYIYISPQGLNVSINNNQIFYSLSRLSIVPNQTQNFYNTLNNYLSSCTYVSGNCIVPIQFNSATAGNLEYSNFYTDNVGFIEGYKTFNNNTVETKAENFTYNISYDSTAYTLSASLIYNNTEYPSTIIRSGYVAQLNNTINEKGTGNKTFYYKIGLTNATATYYYNSTFANQTVALLNMSFCNNPYTSQFLNYTFHNETLANERVKSTFDVDFTYWLSNPLINKTYSFTNATENWDYGFCFTPAASTIYVDATGVYDNSVSQQRSFSNNSMTLTNTTTFKDLLLLPNSNGIYITFIVTNTYGQKISGAFIDVKKTSGLVPVEQKYTDGTGAAAFWLDTGTSYTITTSATGYITESTGITPSSSPVTILLTTSSNGGVGVDNDKVLDINIKITPYGNELINDTLYTFTFNISTERDLDEYGFALWNSTTRLTSYQTGNEINGERLFTSFNTGNQTYIIMKYYYEIDGELTNGTKVWYVVNDDGTDFSIFNALGNLDATLNSSNGLFGVKKGTTNGDFTLAILIFLVILIGAGSMTYKYGITSITATMFFIFAIVLFIDVGAGIMPNPVGSVIPHFLTWLVGVITLYLFIKEGTS